MLRTNYEVIIRRLILDDMFYIELDEYKKLSNRYKEILSPFGVDFIKKEVELYSFKHISIIVNYNALYPDKRYEVSSMTVYGFWLLSRYKDLDNVDIGELS